MGRKTIPPAQKRKIIQRLAEGQSTREAIKGTVVTSNWTSAQLAKTNETAQARQRIIKLIEEKYKANEDFQAKTISELMVAENLKSSLTEPDRWVPDHKTRLATVQYVHKLKGINADDPPDTTVIIPMVVIDNGRANISPQA